MTPITPPIDAYFIDIETVKQHKDYPMDTELGRCFQKANAKEISQHIPDSVAGVDPTAMQMILQNVWDNKAALSAEYGKIVCISVGKITRKDNAYKLYIKSFCSRDEKRILVEFIDSIKTAKVLCAHNGKDFDFPFLLRRMLVNRITVPGILNPIGKKSWDLALEDTVEMWSGTQWKHKASLNVLATLFGLPSPKQDMDGSMVGDVFYSMFDKVPKTDLPFDAEDAALKRISTYCNADIITLANVYCAIKQLDVLIKPEDVVYA